ncbi:MAG: hypothetical protein AB8U25_01215 [Rickettsiales endosymbiont of Dermacentor nuttalli]
MVSDILRDDLVKVFGGFYIDLNYILHKFPENLMKKADFFAITRFEGVHLS